MTGNTTQDSGSKSPPDTATRLAFERTFLAHERTQMAWTRTSLALISFGFGIAKFYQYLHETQGEAAPLIGPRTVGMFMIAMGLIGLLLANIQHYRAMRLLRSEYQGLRKSIAGAVAWSLMALGIVAFVIALV